MFACILPYFPPGDPIGTPPTNCEHIWVDLENVLPFGYGTWSLTCLWNTEEEFSATDVKRRRYIT
jgi:hypothetical protein